MKKPKWRISFRILKNSQFSFKLNWWIVKKLLWKDKFASPRCERCPTYSFSWFWFQLDFIQGHDEDWEWWLWCIKYCDSDINKAKETWPWGKSVPIFDGSTKTTTMHNTIWERGTPWKTYNK